MQEEDKKINSIDEKDSYFLPSRKQIHKMEKGKWTLLFYRILIVLLILLVIGLVVWGAFFNESTSFLNNELPNN